jgi:polyvinyl alcohol dehydrogenase (cytochrome)
LDAASGKQLWRGYTIDQPAVPAGVKKSGARLMAPSGAPIWSSPTIDTRRGLIYVGTGNNYSAPSNDRSSAVLAFDLATGALRWSWQAVGHDAWNVGCMLGNDNCPKEPGPDYDIGSGTMLVVAADGRDRILAGLKSGMAFALDPDKHDQALWRTTLGRGSIQGGIQFGMASDGQRLYVPIADMADSHDGKVYKSAPHPGLYALDPVTGKLLWSSPAPNVCAGREFCDPGILASIVVIPGIVFAGHEDGGVRAYDAADGKIVWQSDSTQQVATLSGVQSHGGSIGGGGPVVHEGMLYVNSGYGLYFHMPGNLLLAYSVDGK